GDQATLSASDDGFVLPAGVEVPTNGRVNFQFSVVPRSLQRMATLKLVDSGMPNEPQVTFAVAGSTIGSGQSVGAGSNTQELLSAGNGYVLEGISPTCSLSTYRYVSVNGQPF